MKPALDRRWSVLFLIVILGALGALGAAPPGFLRNPKRAFERAQETGQPLLLEFHTRWCTACELMRRITWPAPGVRDQLGGFVGLSVDGEQNRSLVQRYGVDGFPTLVVADPAGREVLVLRGFQSADALAGHLAVVLAGWEELAAQAARSDGGRGDPVATLDLAGFARDRRSWESAERLYRRALARKRSLDERQLSAGRRGLASVLAETGQCREALRVLKPTDDAVDVSLRCSPPGE